MIELKQIHKSYGETVALEQVDLTIPAGVCFGLVGPNGAGKSTLMKILAHVIHDYQGEVTISSGKESLGYVPQDICLEETLSAASNLHFFGKVHGVNGDVLKDREKEVLKQIGLAEKAKAKVMTYSGGMKRRLNIGCAMLHQPEIVIMDEPTVGVDPQSRRHIFELIRSLKKQGKTIIYASHYMEEIESLCDYVAFIDQGKVVEQGEIGELLARYAKPGVFINGDVAPVIVGVEQVTEAQGGGWIIASEQPLDTLSAIAKKCQEKGVEPTQLSLVQPRLEDVFFQLTGTELRDKSA